MTAGGYYTLYLGPTVEVVETFGSLFSSISVSVCGVSTIYLHNFLQVF